LTFFDAIILGIVEGLSEFLPISSTGHLILASALLKLQQTGNHKVFEVTIQSGAMLAVVFIYLRRLCSNPDLLKNSVSVFSPPESSVFCCTGLSRHYFCPPWSVTC